jgi:hypothetical protein
LYPRGLTNTLPLNPLNIEVNTITAISGNAIIIAEMGVSPNVDQTIATQAIVFNGNTGTMYGNVTLPQNVTFPAGKTLTIASGQTFTIPSSRTLTNAGTIDIIGTLTNSGTIINSGTIEGTVSGNQPVGP